MGRLNKSGVRGLIRDHVKDPKDPTRTVERFSIDLRYRDVSGAWQRYRERMPLGTKAAAAKARAQLINNNATAGTLEADTRKPMSLDQALDDYAKAPGNATASKTAQIAILKRLLGAETKLTELSAFAVEKFKRDRRAEIVRRVDEAAAKSTKAAAEAKKSGAPAPQIFPKSDEHTGSASVNRGLATLKHAVGLWLAFGWMPATIALAIRKVKLLKEPPGRVRHLAPAEEVALFGKLPERIRPIIAAAMLSGMRRGELVVLRKTAVDLAAREITLTRTKSGKVRRIPVNDALAVVLETAMAVSTTEHVFVSPKGKLYSDSSVSRAFHRACVAVGIKDLRPHDTRHHFATMIRRAGADLAIVQQLLGHATLQMTTRYSHVGRAELHAAVAKLGSDRIAQYNGVTNTPTDGQPSEKKAG